MNVPARRKLRELREEGGQTDRVMRRLGRTLDTLAGQRAHRALDSYQRNLSGLKTDLGESRAAAQGVDSALGKLGRKTVRPRVELQGILAARAGVAALNRDLDKLDRRMATAGAAAAAGGGGGAADSGSGAFGGIGPGGPFVGGRLGKGALAAVGLGPALGTGVGSMVGGLGGAIGALGPLGLGAGAIGGSMLGAGKLMAIGGQAVAKDLKPALAAHKAYAEQVRKTGADSKEARKKHKAMREALKQLSPQARATAKSMIHLSRDFDRAFTTGRRADRIFRTMNVGVTMLSRRGLPMLTKAFDAMQPVVESNLRRLDRYLGSIRGAEEIAYATRFAPSVADRGYRTAGQGARLGGQLMGGVGMPVAERLLARTEPFLKNRADFLTTPAGRERMAAVENRGVETSRAAGRTGWAVVQAFERLLVGPAGANTVRMLDTLTVGFFPALTDWLNETARYGPVTIDTLSSLTRSMAILFGPGGTADIGSKAINNIAHAFETLTSILGSGGMALAALGTALQSTKVRSAIRANPGKVGAAIGGAVGGAPGMVAGGAAGRALGTRPGWGASAKAAQEEGQQAGRQAGATAARATGRSYTRVMGRQTGRFRSALSRAVGRGGARAGASSGTAAARATGRSYSSSLGRQRAQMQRRANSVIPRAVAPAGSAAGRSAAARTASSYTRETRNRRRNYRRAMSGGLAGVPGAGGAAGSGAARRTGSSFRQVMNRQRGPIRRTLGRVFGGAGASAGTAAGSSGANNTSRRYRRGMNRARGAISRTTRSVIGSAGRAAGTAAGNSGASATTSRYRRGLFGRRQAFRRAGSSVGTSAGNALGGAAGRTGAGMTATQWGGSMGRSASRGGKMWGAADRLGGRLGTIMALAMVPMLAGALRDWMHKQTGNRYKGLSPKDRKKQGKTWWGEQKRIWGNAGQDVGNSGSFKWLRQLTGRKRFQTGGLVGGNPNEPQDQRTIRASAGEFVIRRRAVRNIGMPAMRQINRGVIPRASGRPNAMPAPRRLTGRRNPGKVMADDVVRGLRRVSRPGTRAVVNATVAWGRAMVRQSRRSGPQAAANRIERGTVRELTPLRSRGGRQVTRATQAWGATMRRGGQRIVRNVRGTTNDVTAQWRRGGARTTRTVRAATNDVTSQWRRGGQRTARTVRASTTDVDRQFRRLRRSSEGQTRAAARGVGRNMLRMRRATRTDMSGIENHASRSFSRLRNGVSRSSERIRRNVGRSIERTRRGVGSDFEGMRSTGEHRVERLRRGVEKDFDGMGRAMVRKMSGARRDVDRNFAMIRSSASKQLKSAGLNQGDIRKVMSGRKLAKGGRIRAAGGVRIPGQGTADTVPIAQGTIAAPGELVINRHTEAKHDKDARRHGLPTLSQRVEGERKPHSAAVSTSLAQSLGTSRQRHGLMGLGALSGGYAGKRFPDGGKSVAIPGFPGEFINNRVLGSAMGLIKRFNLFVTDAFATAGHKGAGHLVHGTAMDVTPGTGGSWDTVDKAVAFSRAHGMKVLYNGVPNHGRGHHAHIELKGGVGGGGMMGELKLKALKTKLAGFPGGIAQQTVNNVTRGAQSGWNELAGAMAGGGGGGPVKGSYNVQSLTELARAAGMGGRSRLMAAIAMAESGGNPKALGSQTSAGRARGLWQIMWPLHARTFPGKNPYNPRDNASMASSLLGSGGLGQWEAYTRGMHRRYLGKGGRIADGGWNRRGGSFTTNGPTIFGAGEAGRENVSITPNQRRRPAVGGGSGARGGGSGGLVIDVGGVHIAGYSSTADVLRDADKIGRVVADKIKEAMQGDAVLAADLL